MMRHIRTQTQSQHLRKHFPRRPCLILLMGVAGSGKSTLAREIIRRIQAVYLDNNQIADAFFPDTRTSSGYRKMRSGFYKALYMIAQDNLKLGNSVLLDAPHVKEAQTSQWRDFIKGLVGETDSTLVVIRCLCSENTLRTRISLRGEARDKSKLEHWSEFLSEQPIDPPIDFPHLDINTEKDSAGNIAVAVQYILDQISSDNGTDLFSRAGR
jgi:predicted kinase